jgi:fumarate hydratase subunit beta
MIRLNTPLGGNDAVKLRCGDRVLISGDVYGARDAAHKKFMELLDEGKPLPVELSGEIIYYTGPSPAPPGRVIGACGPTTSSRMDEYAPRLLSMGLKGMLGKGARSDEAAEAVKKYKAVYFAAAGGLGALLSLRIKKAEVIAFPELGPEALWRLKLEEFPAVVAIDSRGVDFFKTKFKGESA